MTKVLVAVAGRNGLTLRLARRLARALLENGVESDVRLLPEDEPGSVSPVGYDAVVLGSRVQAGRWLPAASDFAATHSADLCARPVWLFSREPVVSLAEDVSRVEIRGLAGGADAVRHVAFVSRVARLGFPAPAAPAGPGARTEWGVLRAWARDVAATLDHTPAGAQR